LDAQASADGVGNLPDVGHVRGHYGIAAAEGAFRDGHVDDVVVIRLAGQDPDVPGQLLSSGWATR
jgi:hypothetical protein